MGEMGIGRVEQLDLGKEGGGGTSFDQAWRHCDNSDLFSLFANTVAISYWRMRRGLRWSWVGRG